MTTGAPIQLCWFCKHFDADYQRQAFRFRCSAFPKEVPREIPGGEHGPSFDHRLPHPDDGGIQFEMLDDFDALQQRLPFRKCQSMDVINSALSRTLRELDRMNELHKAHKRDNPE